MATDYAAELSGRADDEVRAYLAAHSGLPGPRGNLELADAFAALASPELITALSTEPDEYLAFCGTEGLGRLVLDPARHDRAVDALLAAASDPRWRVREAVARGLQIVGDADPGRLHALVDVWSRSSNPYVLRAAIAAICEPRLLRSPRSQALAVQACERATAWVLRTDRAAAPDGRRTLRQALGYCWSVAVAANPQLAIGAFTVVAADPSRDAQWIVRSNLTKARMKSALAEHNLSVAG